jgi:hypothetical protein
MAVVFDSAAGGTGYPPNGFSFSHTLGYGQGNDRAVVVYLLMTGSTSHSIGSFQYNWVNLNVPLVVQPDDYFGRIITVRIGYLLDNQLPVNSGSYTVYVNSSQPYDGVVGVASYTGVNQAVPPTVYSEDTGNPELSGTVNTTTVETFPSGMMVDGFGCDAVDPTSFSPGLGQTERVDTQRANSALAVSDKAYPFSPGRMSQTPADNYYAYGHIIAELAASGVTPVGHHNAPIIGANF